MGDRDGDHVLLVMRLPFQVIFLQIISLSGFVQKYHEYY